MNWEKLDWAYLERLRALYLQADRQSKGNYFKTHHEVASYDLTFAQRIGWKWQSVLAELRLRGFEFPLTSVMDWGCGSGIASQVFIEEAPELTQAYFWDQSEVARKYACEKISEQYPAVKAEISEKIPPGLEGLLLSHVLNELGPSQLNDLKKAIQQSEFLLWVENGTLKNSQALSSVRNDLLNLKEWRVLGPCPHQERCPLDSQGQNGDWCHSFAKVPSHVHQSSEWRQFATNFSIDLRSVPFSYLCLVKRNSQLEEKITKNQRLETLALDRMIGRARHYKGHSKILSCHGQRGVSEINVNHRGSSDFVKVLKKEKFPSPLFHAEIVGGTFQSGDWL